MFKDNITEINLELQKPLNTYTQFEIAQMMLDQKKFTNDGKDISTVLNGTKLDTVDCVTEEDLIEKYQEFFKQNEVLNYKIAKNTEENGNVFYTVKVDNIPGIISTKDCTSIGDIKIKNEEVLGNISSETAYQVLQNLTNYVNAEPANTYTDEDDLNLETSTFENSEETKEETIQPNFTDQVELNNQLTQLLEERKKIERTLVMLNMKKNGQLSKQSPQLPSYAERKEAIETQIEALRKNITDNDSKSLEEVQEAVQRLNSFIVDESVKNNSAMPFYNKALETRNKLDILKAMIAVNQLDDGHMYKQALKEAIEILDKEYYANMQPIEPLNKTMEEVKSNVERLNSFIVDESIKNNSAMPFYNKAMATHEKSDIVDAMVEVEQLDDGHMYKQALKEALEVLYYNCYPNENVNIDRLVQAQSSIERYNADLNDEGIKNNFAMPFYNRALETNSYDDILKALEMTEQLDDNHMYKKPLEEALVAMMDTYYPKTKMDSDKCKQEIAHLEAEYEKVVKEEQDTIKSVEPAEKQKQQELENLNKEIERVKQEIEKGKSVDNSQSTVTPPSDPSINNDVNLPGSSSPTAMLPKQPLEADYYKRLEKAANEGPIFHDADLDFDLTPQENKPHIIKSIKKASSNIIKKIRDSKFAKVTTKVLDYINDHKKLKMAIVTSTMVLGIAAVSSVLEAKTNTEDKAVNTSMTIGMDAVDDASVAKENTVDNAMDTSMALGIGAVNDTVVANANVEDIVGNTITEEKTADEQFEEGLQETLNNILDGNTKVYTSVDRASNGIDARNSTVETWENATPEAFFTTENGVAQNVSEEQAKDYWQDGGQVIVRMDNDGTPVGFVPLEQQENNTGKSM